MVPCQACFDGALTFQNAAGHSHASAALTHAAGLLSMAGAGSSRDCTWMSHQQQAAMQQQSFLQQYSSASHHGQPAPGSCCSAGQHSQAFGCSHARAAHTGRSASSRAGPTAGHSSSGRLSNSLQQFMHQQHPQLPATSQQHPLMLQPQQMHQQQGQPGASFDLQSSQLQQLQQVSQQQQHVHAAAACAPAPSYGTSVAQSSGQKPPGEPWFARQPARKRKHAAAVLADCVTMPQPAAADTAADPGTASGPTVLAAVSSAQQLCSPGCMCHTRSPPPASQHSRSPSDVGPAGQGSVAALLGVASSDQAAAQLHGMSRQQLFCFAAQVVAGSSSNTCQAGAALLETCVAATGSHHVAVTAPNSSRLSSRGPPVSPDNPSMRPAAHSSPQRIGVTAEAAAAGAREQASPPDGLLPAAQLESFYSKPMSLAEAAAEAAAMAAAIVAAARAAAAEKVSSSSSMSCSTYSPSPFQGTAHTQGSSGGMSAHRELIVIDDDDDNDVQQDPKQLSGTPSDTMMAATGTTGDPAAASQPGFAMPELQQQPTHLAGAAAGAGSSTGVGVVQTQLCAEDPNQALPTAGSLPLEDVLPGDCFKLKCSPSSSVSQTGRGFDPGLDFGLARDEDMAWLEGFAGPKDPADLDLLDML